MSELPEFKPFPKIPRLKRTITITEKIDGTNAQIVVLESGQVLAGSRNRWITPESDNAGFAAWVKKHETRLAEGLGPGQHFGEWWGAGIQRRYGLQAKYFSLFNTDRWRWDTMPAPLLQLHVGPVPTLYQGDWSQEAIEEALVGLRYRGSIAAPGFQNPEGIVVFHHASKGMYKVLLENDELPKGLVPFAEKSKEDPR